MYQNHFGRRFIRCALYVAVSILFTLCLCPGLALGQVADYQQRLQGKTVHLKVTASIGSNISHVGDTVQYAVVDDVIDGTTVLIPKKTLVIGTVKRIRPTLAFNLQNIPKYGQGVVTPWISVTADVLKLVDGTKVWIALDETITEHKGHVHIPQSQVVKETTRVPFKDEYWTQESLLLPRMTPDERLDWVTNPNVDKIVQNLKDLGSKTFSKSTLTNPQLYTDKIVVDNLRAAGQILGVDHVIEIFNQENLKTWADLKVLVQTKGLVAALESPSFPTVVGLIIAAGEEIIDLYKNIVAAVHEWELKHEVYIAAGTTLGAHVIRVEPAGSGTNK